MLDDIEIFFEPRTRQKGGYGKPPFHWQEVENSLNGLHRNANPHMRPPSDLQAVTCPKCQNPMTALYWANSDECWMGLCGVAGWIRYCRPCQSWTSLIGGERLIS